jgi:hypothetical protein
VRSASQGRSYPKMKCTQICLKVWWSHLAEVALRQGAWWPLHIWQNKISKSTTYLYYIALLNILFFKIYVQKLTCCSWKLGFPVDTILSFLILHPSVFKKPFSLCSPCRIRDYPEQNISLSSLFLRKFYFKGTFLE